MKQLCILKHITCQYAVILSANRQHGKNRKNLGHGNDKQQCSQEQMFQDFFGAVFCCFFLNIQKSRSCVFKSQMMKTTLSLGYTELHKTVRSQWRSWTCRGKKPTCNVFYFLHGEVHHCFHLWALSVHFRNLPRQVRTTRSVCHSIYISASLIQVIA